jgi:hypothetical protein
MMLKKQTTCLALLLLLASAAGAAVGIRGPGKYSGIVVFDRWDTCYIYDGAYLIYASETVKERLRKYEGRYVEVYAKEVIQPMNPGDARIMKFDILSVSPARPRAPRYKNLAITAEPLFEPGRKPRFALAIENRGGQDVKVAQFSITPTLLGEKDEADIFSPSDGESEARITRSGLDLAKLFYKEHSVVTKPDGQTTTLTKGFSFEVQDANSLPEELLIPAGQTVRITVALNVPPGDYDFLFACDVGIRESRRIASNIISFNVSDDSFVSLLNDRPLDTGSDENTNP